MNHMPTQAENHLLQFADLDRFWIFRSADIQPGLIHFGDSLGQAMILMMDDENLLEQCIALLESRDCPVFDDIALMDSYAERFIPKAATEET
ncbi:MAG: hypothetical protein JWM11_6991 [Planctomycetaceae bacterium]|nr:hypothetical protein [Planctomycetaceae bacterium]